VLAEMLGGLDAPHPDGVALRQARHEQRGPAAPTSSAPRKPGSFTPKRYWKKLSCRRAARGRCRTPGAAGRLGGRTTAPLRDAGCAAAARRGARRWPRCMDMGTAKVPGPIENCASFLAMARLCSRIRGWTTATWPQTCSGRSAPPGPTPPTSSSARARTSR
jgi:hypothetical protein